MLTQLSSMRRVIRPGKEREINKDIDAGRLHPVRTREELEDDFFTISKALRVGLFIRPLC